MTNISVVTAGIILAFQLDLAAPANGWTESARSSHSLKEATWGPAPPDAAARRADRRHLQATGAQTDRARSGWEISTMN